MRNLSIILTLAMLTSVFTACKTNNDVVSNGIFQKRKHTSGFHWAGIKKEGKKAHQLASKQDNKEIGTEYTADSEASQNLNNLLVPVTSLEFLEENQPSPALLLASNNLVEQAGNDNQTFFIATHVEKAAQTQIQQLPLIVNQPAFKKKSAIKKRSAWALFLSLMGSILFTVLAINAFAAFLPGGVLALTIAQLALLVGGLLLGWKHKETNGASRAAFVLSWIFLGLTALLYFSLIVLGML